MLEMPKLGRTGIDVTSICLGMMTWGQQNTEAEGHAQLDHGINFIDTAEMYSIPSKAETQGSTERIIGTWLAACGGRDKLVLATKVSGRSSSDWLRPDGKGARLDEANIRYAVEQSLRRLRTDYIDLYQLHWPDRRIGLFGEGAPSSRACRARTMPSPSRIRWRSSRGLSRRARFATSACRTRPPGARRASCT